MSTNRSIGRSASTQEKGRSASKSKKGRSPNLCAFTFADGRQCRTPRCSGHLHLCYFHAQKEAESLAAQQVGQDISRFLPTKLLTACDLGVALSRTFCAVARGDIKPKVASTLGYLAQTMLQSIPIAQHEYCEALGTDYWRGAIRSSFKVVPSQEPSPTPQPQPAATPAGCHSERSEEPAFSSSAPSPTPASSSSPVCPPERSEEPASSSNSSLATHHSPLPQPPQPAPSPHTPLPATSAEFAQQVLAGRNSSRPSREPGSSGSSSSSASSSSAPSSTGSSTNQTQPQPTSAAPRPVEARLQPGSSGSSPSPAPSSASSSSNSAPARTPSTQPAPPSPCTPPTPNKVPTPAPPAPPLVPPGFGAPANWDALIPPKPRRRFSRHWQLPE